MLSLEDLESLEETLDVLNSPDLLADIREALASTADSRTLTKDEALRLAAGR